MCEAGSSLRSRFWNRVDLGLPNDCWEWKGAVMQGIGYGKLWMNGRDEGAHRVSYHLATGRDLTDVVVVRHTCDNRLCVNPRHLLEGTQADNGRDMALRGRSPSGEKHPNSKLTWAAVRAIRAGYAAGESTVALGARFGVSSTNIGYVLRGHTWKEPAA